VRKIDLITLPELEEIRRIWVVGKHEFEDRLPVVYEETMGSPYPGNPMDELMPLGADDVAVLRNLTNGDQLHFEMVRELLDIEQRHRSQGRRAGLFDALEGALKRGFYMDETDATARARRRIELGTKQAISLADPEPVDFVSGFVRPVGSQWGDEA
jgi:DNA sulfur modification protein DndC